MMYAFRVSRGQSLGLKGASGNAGIISTASPETSPLAYSLTIDTGSREWIWWLEALADDAGNMTYGAHLRLRIDAAEGFESYSDRNPPALNPNGFAAFLHGGQLKAQVLHFRGSRPPGGPTNDNTRDEYTYRSGLYLVELLG